MTRDGMDSDDMDLLGEVSDQAAFGGSIQTFPAEDVAPHRGEFWEHRNVYDGKGEYELPTARHYVPQYWRS
jgi:hypothetical protein